MDLSGVITDAIPALGADSAANLTFWTEDELYELMDEAAKELARTCGVFVTRDTSTAVAAGTATYAAPTGRVSTVHVSLGTASLLPSTVQEVESLDDDWIDTTGTPKRWLPGDGTEQIRLCPTPNAIGTLNVVHQRFPATITQGAATIGAPLVAREYFYAHVISEARSKESKAAMPDVSQWYDQLKDQITQAFQAYWGGAQ